MSRSDLWQRIVRRIPWVHLALFVGVFAVYLLTLTPGVLGGDVGELQFVPYILGLAHPTGTPFYMLLGKIWTMLPLGPSVAWRMNLLSAVAASLAVVVVYHHLRWRTKQVVPALVAALVLAFGATLWEQAIMADKYAFNALLVALVLHLSLRWGETRSPATLNMLVFTYGLSLTHHRTMLLFAPILFGYVWWHEKGKLWRDWRRLLRLAVLLAAPLLFYLYLPWAESRNLPPGTWHPNTLGEWYHYIMDTGRIGYVYVDPADLADQLLFYGRTLVQDFTWIGVLLGLAGLAWQFLPGLAWQFLPGLAWQFLRRPADAVFLLATFGLQAFLAANHHVPRHWVYFLPSFVIFALWIGEALGAVWTGLTRLTSRWRKWSVALVVILTLLTLSLPLVPFPERYQLYREHHYGAGVLDFWRQELKRGRMGDRLGQAIAEVKPGAVIVCDWEQATPLWYYQQVEGQRPDVQILYPIEKLEQAAATGRPLYLARTHSGLADRWHPSASGPLIALHQVPIYELPPDISPLDVQLGDSFRLAGAAYGEAGSDPVRVLPLTLYWRAIRPPAHDYSVSLRLFDEAGQQVFKIDTQHPVLGTYPTSLWTADEVVADYYEIPLAPDLPPGRYRWGVILYRALPEGGWENLQVAGADGEVAFGGTIDLK